MLAVSGYQEYLSASYHEVIKREVTSERQREQRAKNARHDRVKRAGIASFQAFLALNDEDQEIHTTIQALHQNPDKKARVEEKLHRHIRGQLAWDVKKLHLGDESEGDGDVVMTEEDLEKQELREQEVRDH